MAFLRREDESGRRLIGESVYLRHPELRDFGPWASLRDASRSFLAPWEPTWPDNDLTRVAYREKLRRYAEDIQADRSYPFYVLRTADDLLVGGATLNRIHRGSAQSCSLGYWVGEPHQRRGYMRAAVQALIRFAFRDIALHRMEAACQPDNVASRALLLGMGFEEEGRARGYLKINGAWRDHLLFGLNASDARY